MWNTMHENPSEVGRWMNHPFLPFVGQPNAEYVVQGSIWGEQVEGRVRNNSLGFRTHELPEARPEGAYIVVTLGGSTTWGAVAASNEETWPALLETMLRGRYSERDVRVFNFGTQNVTLPYSVAVFSLMAAPLDPDLVVVYHGFNDWAPSVSVGYRPDHSHYFRDLDFEGRWRGLQIGAPEWATKSYAVRRLTFLFDHRLLRANRLGYFVVRPYLIDSRIFYREPRHEAYLSRNWEHLRTIDAIARGSGGRALFSTFQYFDGSDFGNRQVNETLREFFAENSLSFVDQDALIPDRDRTLQFDECHFTKEGRETIARNFFDEIVSHGWVQ